MAEPENKKAPTIFDKFYSIDRLKIIFEYLPIAIWEEDFSALADLQTKLKKRKVKNIKDYLRDNQSLVADTFRNLKVLDVNQAALKMYGAKSKKELLENLGKRIHKDALKVMTDEFAALLTGDELFEAEFKSKTLDGKGYDVKIRVAVPKVYKDTFERVIVTLQDISVQKKYERHLKRLARTDSLTKLLNQSTIRYRLEEEFARAMRYNLELSVLLIDLDDFKYINDKYGHTTGDSVLKKTAAFIADHLRDVDLVGRIGGDEFMAILPETASDNAEIVAQRLVTLFSELAAKKGKKNVFSTMTIGIASGLSKGVKSAESMIQVADRAMYRGKKAGKNNFITVA